MGMIQHAAALLLAVQAVWVHLEQQTKPMQFPSCKVEASWGLSPRSKGNFFISCPKYDIPIIPASGMFWQPKASM